LATAFAVLLNKEGFSPGDSVVVISDVLAGTGTDAIQVRQLHTVELEPEAGE
jgi:adenine/guanine phosphoribosyltransferase-like PRPP-binding protein